MLTFTKVDKIKSQTGRLTPNHARIWFIRNLLHPNQQKTDSVEIRRAVDARQRYGIILLALGIILFPIGLIGWDRRTWSALVLPGGTIALILGGRDLFFLLKWFRLAYPRNQRNSTKRNTTSPLIQPVPTSTTSITPITINANVVNIDTKPSYSDRIRDLSSLRINGVIDDDEYTAAKQKALGL